MRSQRGMTLVELLTVIAIAAILAMVAVPSFTRMIALQRVKSAASTLQVALYSARAEAIKQNANICVTTATTTCTSSSSWNSGFYVVNTSGPKTINTYSPYSSLTITGPTTGVTYQGSGRINGTSPIVSSTMNYFKVSSSSITDVRCVYISPMGSPSVTSTCP